MNIEAIVKLVTAWRLAKKLSDGMEMLFDTTIDYMYDIHGNILDALREYAFEKGDLDDSDILRMMESDSPAHEVANTILTRHDQFLVNHFSPIRQPKPTFFTQEQIDRMNEVFGSYVRSVEK